MLAQNDLRLLRTERALILVVLRRVEVGLYVKRCDLFGIHSLFKDHDLREATTTVATKHLIALADIDSCLFERCARIAYRRDYRPWLRDLLRFESMSEWSFRRLHELVDYLFA